MAQLISYMGCPYILSALGSYKAKISWGGIVYELNKKELFYAWKGGGTFLNDNPIRVAPTQDLSNSLLATGFPYYQFDKLDNYLAIIKDLMMHSHSLRRLGSAAVDLAYVACSRYEGFFEYNLNA